MDEALLEKEKPSKRVSFSFSKRVNLKVWLVGLVMTGGYFSVEHAWKRTTLKTCFGPQSCFFSGDCKQDGDACECDEGFRGQFCETLDIEEEIAETILNVPLSDLNGTRITTTWDGHVGFEGDCKWFGTEASFSSNEADCKAEWFGSVMMNGESLENWTTASAIGRATAVGSPLSLRYDLVSLVALPDPNRSWVSGSLQGAYLQKNPNPWKNATDKWLLFFTGTDRRDPLESRKIGVMYSPSLDGPWEMWPVPIFAPSNSSGDFDTSSVSNPSPAFSIDRSGSLKLAYKGLRRASSGKGKCEVGTRFSCVFFARAPHWTGPYERFSSKPGPFEDLEDPTMWQDKRGVWHLVFKQYVRNLRREDGSMPAIGHAYSLDGFRDWKTSPTSSWISTRVIFNGTYQVLSRLERPQITFFPDDTHIPFALFQGICLNDFCQNAAFRFRTRRRMG